MWAPPIDGLYGIRRPQVAAYCLHEIMSQSSTTITLPICTIQTDFKSLIEDVRNGAVPEDTFWLSCYKTGEPSVHGKVHLTLNEIDRDLVVYEGTEGVEFEVDGDVSGIPWSDLPTRWKNSFWIYRAVLPLNALRSTSPIRRSLCL